MMSYLKQLLKKNPLTHSLGKRVRNWLLPQHEIAELATAWSRQFFYTDQPDLCYTLYKKCRDYQQALSARMFGPVLPAKRYLGFAWLHDMGTLAHLDIYAKIGLLGWRPPQESILVVKPGEVANPYLFSLWKKHFSVLEDPALQQKLAWEIPLLTDYYLFMEIGAQTLFSMTAAALVLREWEQQKRAPLPQLNADVIERGYETLARIGMPRDAWFIALHVRESGYFTPDYNPLDAGIRNAQIETFLPAIRKIVDNGGWVIRLGNPTMTPLPKMDRVFDYALSDHRSDWMDMFLASRCRFLVGCQSGMSHVGDIFGVPTLYANWASCGYWPPGPANVIIPKLLWSRERQRPLTMDEIREAGLGCCQDPAIFTAKQVEIRDNTPEQLEAGVGEMLRATESSQWNRPDDQVDIKEFLAEREVVLNGTISDAFLAEHANLFM